METQLKPDPKLFRKHIIVTLIVSIIFLPLFIVFCMFENAPKINGDLLLQYGSIIWVVLAVIILVFDKLWINNLTYVIKGNSITIYKGIFTKIEQNIPNKKVTDFVLYRDLIDRFLGIGSIKVQTAGASGESGFEGVIDGLDNYESIHKELRERLEQINSGTSKRDDSNSSSSENSLLSEILSELKDINKKLNK